MRVIAGDETGFVKVLSLEDNLHVNVPGDQSRERAVEAMCWVSNEQQTTYDQIVVAYGNGIIKHWDIKDMKSSWEIKCEGPVVGMGMRKTSGHVVACSRSSKVQILNPEDTDGTKTQSFEVHPNVGKMRLNPFDGSNVAVGGKEHDLHLWDLETAQVTFRAKNVPHDSLDMRVPIWIKDMDYFAEGNQLITGTAYHQIRIYDVKAKRRPMHDIAFGEYPINALKMSPDERLVLFADTTGDLNALDMRTLKHLGRFAGPGGSIRDIACHPTLPYFAAAGLDRMVYVYNLHTRKCIHKVYVKQRQNAVLFTNDLMKGIAAGEGVLGSEEVVDDQEMSDGSEAEAESYEGLDIDTDESMCSDDSDADSDM